MPELSRSQVVVYGAVAVALLLVGARAIRAEGGARAAPSRPAPAAAIGRVGRLQPQRRRPATSSSTSPARSRGPASTGCRPGAGSTTRSSGPAGPRAEARAGSDQPAPPGSPTASRWWCPSAARRASPSRRRGGRRRADQPRHRHRRAARHDRRHRPGHRRGHRRVPRPARRPRLGRPARPGLRDRAGDDGVAARPPAALRRAMRAPRPSLPVLLGIAAAGRRSPSPTASEIRERAEDGLGRGMPAREAELARGFVLGEDEGIDARTGEDFRRAGLSHLLAVSRPERRPCWRCWRCRCWRRSGSRCASAWSGCSALIAVYVPLAGAGPVDPAGRGDGRAGRAGDAGGPARLAPLRAGAGAGASPWRSTPASPPTSAGSSASPRCSASSLLAAPLRGGDRGAARRAGGWRGALAEGAAVTVAATLATAPLIAFHFGRTLDHDPARQPAGDAGGGAGDVAGDG